MTELPKRVLEELQLRNLLWWYSLIRNEVGPDETLRRRQATQRRVAQALRLSH